MSLDIKNFAEFIKPLLIPGQELVSYECENLLSPGENYGSVLLKVKAKILNEDREEDIHYVAKTCPPPGFLWKVFNIKMTFKKEITMYTTIVPALNDFGKEKEIDCIMDFFPKSVGARISLDPDLDEVDENAVLLLENLKVQGYDTCDRFNGFDEEATKLLLRDLATLHATPMAFKSVKPDDFQTKIFPHLKNQFHFQPNEENISGLIENIQKAVSGNSNCLPHLNKIEEAIRGLKNVSENPVKGKDIYTTIIHKDFWVNNTMLKYEDGKPISNKMVDFQLMEYGSLAHDVIFFLYSSVNLAVLESKVDDLIKFYYEEFIKTLVKLQHDVSQYSFESMMEEFASIARHAEFGHILFMLTPIMTLKEKAKKLSEVKENSLKTEESSLHKNYNPKIQFVLLDFVRKGWI